MSTSSTVDVRVSCSVRWTSKSVGREADPPVAGRGPRGRGVLLASEGVEERPAQVEMERVAELVRLGRLLALPAPARRGRSGDRRTRPAGAARTGRRGPSGRSAGCPRGVSSSRSPVAGQVAGLLEPPGEVVEGVEVAHARRRPAGRGPRPGRSRRDRRATRRRTARPRAGPSPGAGAIWASAPSSPSGSSPPNGTRSPRPPGSSRSRFDGELGEVDQQPVVAEERLHHRLELGPLLRAHRAHQRLHGGHPLGQLVDDVVEGLGAREEPAVLGQELAGVRVAAADPLADQLVEVADHLAVRGEVLRASST